MTPTRTLHEAGQSLWLDNITRDLLDTGGLQRHIDERSVTGLTSNPTIFDKAISAGESYDGSIKASLDAGREGEEAFFDLALEDITRAADLFLPVHQRTGGVDGFVSLEVSPLLARDSTQTAEWAVQLHQRAGRPNVFIKIPGTPEGLPAIEESIFAGIPINVTLLFSREHYLAAADAYLRGLERRVEAGLSPDVASVASVFISRWDKKVPEDAPAELHNALGIAIGQRTYAAYRDLLGSDRMQRLANAGARPQRLLYASTGTKDPKASDVLYVEALASPLTVNTMPEGTLEAFADHGTVGALVPRDGGDAEETLAAFARAGVDVDAVAEELQQEGADAFVDSWKDMLDQIASRSAALAA